MIVWFGCVGFGWLFVMVLRLLGGLLSWMWCGDCLLVWLVVFRWLLVYWLRSCGWWLWVVGLAACVLWFGTLFQSV